MQTMGETKETNREDTTRHGDNTSTYLDMPTAGQKDEETHSADRLSSKQAQERSDRGRRTDRYAMGRTGRKAERQMSDRWTNRH